MDLLPKPFPVWSDAVGALLVPLAILSFAASVVWGLQEQMESSVGRMRALAKELREARGEARPATWEQLALLVKRAWTLRAGVLCFYSVIGLQLLAAAYVGLCLLQVPLPPMGAVWLHYAAAAVLGAALVLTLTDLYISFRDAESEAKEANLPEC